MRTSTRRRRRNADAPMPTSRCPTRSPTPTPSPRSASARAEQGLDAVIARALAVLEQAHIPHQVDPELRRRIIDEQSSHRVALRAPSWRASTASPWTTTRSSPYCARATTRRTGGPRGRHRRPSAPRSRPTCASWPVSATRPHAASATATISRWRLQRPSTTRSGCSRPSKRSTSSRASRSVR